MNRSGYSPVQRQIGQWPRLPGSLMSDEFLDPALQLQNTSDEFDHLLELRRLAQEACVARSRVQRIFKAGDVVYVYRALRRKKSVRGLSAARGHGLGRKATWVGPGHVLVPEGSVVWINMFGELWRASIEQAREATTVEKLGVEMVAEGLEHFLKPTGSLYLELGVGQETSVADIIKSRKLLIAQDSKRCRSASREALTRLAIETLLKTPRSLKICQLMKKASAVGSPSAFCSTRRCHNSS